MHVARCESTMNPNAYSAGNYGLFQIAYSAHRDLVTSPAALYDPEVNTAIAFELWTEQGWRPWACRP